jgi:ABC-type ATPase involved in cell division
VGYKLNNYPDELSGGGRVDRARAVNRPLVLLADGKPAT